MVGIGLVGIGLVGIGLVGIGLVGIGLTDFIRSPMNVNVESRAIFASVNFLQR